MNKLLLSALAVSLLAACSTPMKPAATNTPPVENKSKPSDEMSSTAGTATNTTTDTSSSSNMKMDPLKDPNNILSKRSVYFDYDKFDIKDESRALVEAHGRYLAGNTSRSVRIEGNTDERGSREYNLALGQKRAETVRKALASFGAGEKQMEAVSNGEEKPKATGKDESAYAENRRADLFYPGE